jgi:hypothetical protein
LGLCALLLEVCRRKKFVVLQQHLRLLAELSFPIFFVHPLLTMGIENLLEMASVNWSQPLVASLLGTLVIFVLQLYGSLVLVLWLRRRLGARGQWLVG